MEGYYFKPRMDRELLADLRRRASSPRPAAPSGEIQTRLRLGQYDEAREAAAEFRDIFGEENFYCEIMDHGLDIERRAMKDLLRLAKDLGLPLVATNDLHYTKAEDAKAHAALLCVQSGSTLIDPNRFKFDADEFYLKTPAADAPPVPRAARGLRQHAAHRRALRRRPSPRARASYMPRFPCPEGENEESWFVKEVETRPARPLPRAASPTTSRTQADYEIEVIVGKGYPGYFLVVADFINWAKAQRHPGRPRPWLRRRLDGAPTRCGITDLDPLAARPDLRAVPQPRAPVDARLRRRLRRAPPRRGHPLRHREVRRGARRPDRHLRHHQGQAGASRTPPGCWASRSRWARSSPRRCRRPIMGKDIPLSGIFDHEPPALQRGGGVPPASTTTDPQAQEVVETALGLEGLKRQWGVHAAGVIMSSEPLIDLIPIMRREQDGQIITQFDYPSCETLGLVKMDFLGLRNLTILDDALANVEANRGIDIDLDALSQGPRPTRRPTSCWPAATPSGVFQLDGGRMRTLLRQMKPDNFEDISAVDRALPARPDGRQLATPTTRCARTGSRRSRRSTPSSRSRSSRSSARRYGLIVYQEQVHADRAEGRRLHARPGRPAAPGDGQEEEARSSTPSSSAFEAGMQANGYSAAAIKTLWDILVPVLRLRLQQGALRGLRRWSPTGPPTSRRTTRPSTWPRC